MKPTIMLTLAVAVVVLMFGCQSSSPRGGGMTKEVGFSINIQNFDSEIKQGQTKYFTVSLDRGGYFKQDVQLEIETSAGLSVNPDSLIIKASDMPDAQIEVFADQNAAIGEYQISITGTPETGEPTSVVVTMKVVSP